MPQGSRRRLVYASATIGFGCAVLIVAIWWIALERVGFERRQSMTDIQNENANLSLLLEARTEDVLHSVEQRLRVLRGAWMREGVNLPQMLKDVRIEGADPISMAVVGPDGRVTLTGNESSGQVEPDRELFARMAAHPSEALQIGKTHEDAAGRLSLQVASPILNPDGSFRGATVEVVDISQLVSIYGQTSLGKSDMILLVGTDGIARVRRAGSKVSFGEDMSNSDLLKNASHQPFGSMRTRGMRDGVVREMTYRVMRDYPLIVIVGIDKREAFSSFRGHRRSYYTVATMATLALLLLAGVVIRLVQRERQAIDAVVRNEARFRATFDQAFVGMAQAGPGGVLLQVNHTLCDITGYPEVELLGRSLNDFVHPEDRASVWPLETDRVGDMRLLRKDGQVAWTNIASTAVRNEQGIDCLVIVVQDITEFKRIDRMKSEFVSIVSHELRTPLTSIRGSLGLIAGGVAGVLPDAAKNLVDIAKNNCERLIRLINDILDTEKIESGKMSFDMRELDLVELMTAAVEANEGFATQHQVKLHLVAPEGALAVRGDADRLTQVATNLLSNAMKFSPAGAEVEVAVMRKGERARVEVRDRGPGIPEQFRGRIFQKFSQADSSDTRQKGGTGLGLNISKAIVERLGGTIGFETESGVGTTFFFELPAAPTERAPLAAVPIDQPRVLVCEDDPDIARLIAMMLDKAGYATDIAYDAAGARRMAFERRYEAITVDLKLPDEPGISLIRTLRRTPATRDLPVIVISAVADQGRLELNGEDLPVADWLQKPIDENRLARAVRRAVADTDGMWRILHVEDDPDIQRIAAAVAQDFASFEFAGSVDEARSLLRRWRFDLVLLDLELPDGSGWDLLAHIQGLIPPPPVVVFSVQEVEGPDRKRVAAVLLKAQTSNEDLLATIHRVLGHPHPRTPGA